MKAEREAGGCREWRGALGAYALGNLPEDERAGLEAHLEGCPDCRAEAVSLRGVANLLPLADPAHFEDLAPRPSSQLGARIAATIGDERRGARQQQWRRRGTLALGGVAAVAAAVVLAVFVFTGGGSGAPEQHVAFASLPTGVTIDATLEPRTYGTEIRMYVSGVRSGTLCRVFLRGPHGVSVPAGTFRYRWGNDSTAVLTAALDLSRTRAIGVRAGNRTFLAPVRASGATGDNRAKERTT